MPPLRPTRWTGALVFSGAALLSFLTRTFIDYRFVYAELNFTNASLISVTLFNLAFYGGWIWALVSASHRRRPAMYILIGYATLLIVYGLATSITWCPSPCQTAWPFGELTIWSNYVLGITAVSFAALSLWAKQSHAD